MSNDAPKRKQFLFVDDDAALLDTLRQLFSEMSHGTWEIFTAQNHAETLALLHEHKLDVVVLDIGMPVMDGVELLRLLGRTHPGQQIVMLTGLATPENRKTCLDLGVALFLEKPSAPGGYAAVFAALDALAGALPQEGFRGVMRQVGLHDVLQMECLGTKSSVLEVFTGKVRGRIYIRDGTIMHAESGMLQGEVALYSLLALRGGGFNLLPFVEPPGRTIEGQWEFLLMEAARLRDESGLSPETQQPVATPETIFQMQAPASDGAAGEPMVVTDAPMPISSAVQIEEIVLCSGAGELLYDWECKSLERRMQLLEQVEQQALSVCGMAPIGRFDRLEIVTADGRIVCQLQPDRRLFVRSSVAGGGG